MSKVFNKLLKTTTSSCKNIKKLLHIVIIYHKSKAVQALWNNCSVLQLMPQKALTAWRQPATLWLPGNATPAALPVSYKKAKARQSPRAATLAACCRVRLQLALLARCVRSLATHAVQCRSYTRQHQAAANAHQPAAAAYAAVSGQH
jgi:hypothetical protein